MLNLLRDLIYYGVQVGQFRDLDPELTATIICSTLDHMFIRVPRFNNQIDFKEDPNVIQEIKCFIINALITPE